MTGLEGGLGAAPWVDKLLNANWDAIVARTPEGAIPEIQHVTARGRVVASELGCGHYGCVMPTADPNIVCKITSDETEAHFVRCALELGQPDEADGLVRYLGIYAIPEGSYRDRQAFILWREGVSVAGGTWGLEERERPQRNEVVNLLRVFGQGATAVREAIQQMERSKSRTMKEYLDEVDALESWAYDFSAEHFDVLLKGDIRSWKKDVSVRSLTRGRSSAQRYAAGLRICAHAAEWMENTYLADSIGRALSFYLENGLLLADVHGGNIGRAERVYDDGKPWRPLVITDPGHAVVLDEDRWSTVAVDEL